MCSRSRGRNSILESKPCSENLMPPAKKHIPRMSTGSMSHMLASVFHGNNAGDLRSLLSMAPMTVEGR